MGPFFRSRHNRRQVSSPPSPGSAIDGAVAGQRLGLAAFALGLLSALVSAYWASGGTIGLDTIGGELAALARARDPGVLVLGWAAAVLKLVVALLGLALVEPWGRRLPRKLLLLAAWGASAVLVLYGGGLVLGQALVKVGAIPASPDMDWYAFSWHLYLWDPWFLLWGLLLGAAAWRSGRLLGTTVRD